MPVINLQMNGTHGKYSATNKITTTSSAKTQKLSTPLEFRRAHSCFSLFSVMNLFSTRFLDGFDFIEPPDFSALATACLLDPSF